MPPEQAAGRQMSKDCRLRFYSDHEDNVCVRVPVGDFFGSGCGDHRFQSLPTGMTDQSYYAYWPMPFRKSAVVTLRNDTAQPVKIDRCKVGYSLRPQASNAGYFHARCVEISGVSK